MPTDTPPKRRYRLPECAGQLPGGVGWILRWIRGLEVPLSSALQLSLPINAHHAADTMLSQGVANEPAWVAEGCEWENRGKVSSDLLYLVHLYEKMCSMIRSERVFYTSDSTLVCSYAPGSCPTHSGSSPQRFRGVSDCPKSVMILCTQKIGFRPFKKIQVYIFRSIIILLKLVYSIAMFYGKWRNQEHTIAYLKNIWTMTIFATRCWS